MLEKLFGSKTIVEILTILFTNPNKRFYLRELSNLTALYPHSVASALIKLEEAKIVLTKKKGNLKYFSLNKENPLYPELKNIILKTTGVGEAFREGLKDLGEIKAAFIYGSVASGKEEITSDIDLMLIGEIDLDKANELISNLERKLGREINYTVFTPSEWEKRKKKRSGFVKDVLDKKKIFLIGNRNDI